MTFITSRSFLAASTVFLLLAIPLTTYLVINSQKTTASPQAAVVCEENCNNDQTKSNTKKIDEDFNSDGLVNQDDLAILVSQMGKSGPNQADLNGDQKVDSTDLAMLKSAWTK